MINVVKIYVTIEMKSNHRMIAKISHLLDFSHFLISLRIKK
jgi:ribosomal protein L30/L7E